MPRNAFAYQIPHGAAALPVTADDPDAFDALDHSLYAVAEGDENYLQMIEETLCPLNDPKCVHERVQCLRCGLSAPWASKLGCGLA